MIQPSPVPRWVTLACAGLLTATNGCHKGQPFVTLSAHAESVSLNVLHVLFVEQRGHDLRPIGGHSSGLVLTGVAVYTASYDVSPPRSGETAERGPLSLRKLVDMRGERLSLPDLEMEARRAGLPARRAMLERAPADGLRAVQGRYPEVGTIRASTKLVRDGVEWVLAVTDSETHAFSSDGRHSRIGRVPDYGTLVDDKSGTVIIADDSVVSSGFAGFHRKMTVWSFLDGSSYVLQLRPPDAAGAGQMAP